MLKKVNRGEHYNAFETKYNIVELLNMVLYMHVFFLTE